LQLPLYIISIGAFALIEPLIEMFKVEWAGVGDYHLAHRCQEKSTVGADSRMPFNVASGDPCKCHVIRVAALSPCK